MFPCSREKASFYPPSSLPLARPSVLFLLFHQHRPLSLPSTYPPPVFTTYMRFIHNIFGTWPNKLKFITLFVYVINYHSNICILCWHSLPINIFHDNFRFLGESRGMNYPISRNNLTKTIKDKTFFVLWFKTKNHFISWLCKLSQL